MTVGFAINTEDCFGCKTCQVACANEHLLNTGVYLRRVRKIDMGESGGGTAFVSMSCNHCDEPKCVEVCPVGAYEKKDDGAVIQDHEKCIGCQSCIKACPFHAPCFDESEGATYKCDTCIDRRNAGLLPRCVVSCPGANIAFGDVDDVAGAYTDAVSIKDQAPTSPNLYAKLDKDLNASIFSDIDGDTSVTVDRGGVDF
jgi:anaerobic dimethyl sulfoxide reductase subunit B (iron-sulfur subunit)